MVREKSYNLINDPAIIANLAHGLVIPRAKIVFDFAYDYAILAIAKAGLE